MLGDASMFKTLDRRRRDLGLSYDLLARRSGVSRPTVQRILSGRHESASFANVSAIAGALGFELGVRPTADVPKLRRQQALRKARKLVSLVQGSAGLEGQAVDAVALKAMVEQTTHELLAGPRRRLWGEE
jgi:transcriptional regulator with XRE-family HTH domain